MAKAVKNNLIVKFENVDIVFGDKPASALSMIDEGKTRSEIQEATGQILGVANCSLEIEEGEVLGVDPGTGKNLTGGARSASEGTIVEKLLADEMPECLRDVVVGFSEHALHHFRDRGGFDPGKFLG